MPVSTALAGAGICWSSTTLFLKETCLEMERLVANTTRAVLVLVLATPLVIVSDPLPAVVFPFVVGKALYFRVLVEIALLLWLPLSLWHPAYRPPRSWILGIVGVYVVIALAASFTGVSMEYSLWSNYERMQGWFGLIHYAAFTVMVASMFRTFRAWRALLNFNLLIGLLVGLLGLFQMVGDGDPRISSSLGNPVFLGAYALVNALIAAGFLTHALVTPRKRSLEVLPRKEQRYRQRRSRQQEQRRGRQQERYQFVTGVLMDTFWVATMVLNLLMVFQSGTRGAIIGLVAGLGLFLISYAVWGALRPIRRASVFLIIAGITLVASFYSLQGNEAFAAWTEKNLTLQRLTNLNDASMRSRLDSVQAGFAGFTARPLLGWGPENYSAAYNLYITEYDVITSNDGNFDQAHNQVIEVLVTTGLIGLVGYLAIWGCMAWILIRRIGALPANEQLFGIGIGSALAGYFVQNLFLFDTPGTAVQMYLLIGFVIYLETTLAQEAVTLAHTPSLEDGTHSGSLKRTGLANLLMTTAAALASIAVLIGFYFMVLGPYTGSRKAYAAIISAEAWSERFELMHNAINVAPGLATQPLLIFMEQIVEQWNELTPEEQKRALDLAQGEGEAVLATQPWEWRAHATLARMYQMASLTAPSYLILARDHIDRAKSLAPHRLAVLQLQAQQYVFEGDVPAALGIIDAYFARTAEFLDGGFIVHNRLIRQRKRIVELEQGAMSTE